MSTAGALSIGRLGDPSAVRSLQLDDVIATYVVDGVLTMRPTEFFPAIPGDYWSARPELFTANGRMPMSAGGLLIERDGKSLLIDTGVGTTATDFALGGVDCGSMIDVLEAIGRRTEDIDVVAFTHLHFDHAGWAFAHGARTFPKCPLRVGRAGMGAVRKRNPPRRRDDTVACHLAVGLRMHLTRFDR